MELIVRQWEQKKDSKLEAEGLIRRNNNKPEYGSIMLASKTIGVDNGYLNKKTRIGFITATVEELIELIEDKHLVKGADFSKLVAPHRIVIIEKLEDQLTEDDKGFTVKINPSTGEVLTQGGQTIYRKTEVVQEGSDMKDVLLTHDKEPVVDEANKDFATKNNVVAEL